MAMFSWKLFTYIKNHSHGFKFTLDQFFVNDLEFATVRKNKGRVIMQDCNLSRDSNTIE